ncbi:ATP-dependent helicase [Acetobacterium woodii]|uniref:DNA 3'-5' helicase n=1 Tax=Acetobacterium woodii (strain ATCC 29683 / DSM 1030 / JCM 2381 / KCTC 1655 / WB1) TaxID=931626 RepID=H6LIK9_ACEWD|nr:ATP-dependent helicase [Acetobacterium woodii]AFA48583.1 ATP-dependent DNA helicase PcrA3 [Acetobacterium woodii DSM 1030]
MKEFENQEKDWAQLNAYQKEAVLDESQTCLVNAHVGSGKTTVLIAKIRHLHEAKGIDYGDMIVLTFTNKAANEIKARLLASDPAIPKAELEGFGTFHSVALDLLKKRLPRERLGYTRTFQVITPDEEQDLALSIIKTEKLKIKYKNRLKKRLEAARLYSADRPVAPGTSDDDEILKLLALLTDEKIGQNKMSFSDLIQNATTLINETPALCPRWIIIDEVQDCDQLQLDFIHSLKNKDTQLFAVGDPNQVIYSWRGSIGNVFAILKQQYQAVEKTLPINYRSSASILSAAKCFLKNGENLKGIREPGSKIVVKNQYNPFNEACYLADKIQVFHEAGVPYSEMAVFYRTQNQSKVFEAVFTKNQIPFEVSLKKKVGDVPVLNWLIKLLRASLNHQDVSSAVEVLAHKEYGEKITAKKARKIVTEGLVEQSLLFNKIQGFRKQCANIKTVPELQGYFDFDLYIHPNAASYQADQDAIRDFLNRMIDDAAKKQRPILDSLISFINSSALYGIDLTSQSNQPIQTRTDAEIDAVKLMTLHAAKGLEFDRVFITGINYGLIPLRLKTPAEEAEERRLFFVGMTRARDYLELSYYTNPDDYHVIPGESRYINMIPPQLVENQSVTSQPVNLPELKRQIQAAQVIQDVEKATAKFACKEQIKNQADPTAPALPPALRRVSHKKYGIGEVISEDETMIEVDFENYGLKTFVKAFSELEVFGDQA